MQEKQVQFISGAIKDNKDRRDYRIAGVTKKTVDIPKQEFMLEEPFSVKYQHRRPSCTSQAQSHHKERQEGRASSARMIMALTKDFEGNSNEGARTRNTFIIANKYGVCAEELYPEPGFNMSWREYIDIGQIPQKCYDDAKGHKSMSYWRVNKNFNEIKSVLLQHKSSIVCSMEWFSEFNRPANGVLKSNFANSVGGHAVDLVGWNDFEEWVAFKNSFDENWGDGGFFYMPFSIFDRLIWDLWCSLDIPEKVPVDDYYGDKRTWTSYMREQLFAFNPWLNAKIGRLPNNREIKGLAYGYWSADAVFFGKVGSVWLNITKPEAIKRGVIDKNENIINPSKQKQYEKISK